MRFLPWGGRPLALTNPRRVLAIAMASMIVGMFLWGLNRRDAIAPPEHGATPPSDAALHAATIERLREHEDYYIAVGEELRSRGYPARSIFNWRTPVHYSLLALAPHEAAVWTLRALTILVVLGAIWAFSTQPGARPVAAGCLVLGAMLVPLLDDGAVLFPEICAGVAIGLSLTLYVRGVSHLLAAALAIGAVFLREIAVPYAAVCGILAMRHGRRRESLVWVFGGLLYVSYYAQHAWSVQGHVLPNDLAHPSWIQFQGLPFVLRTLHESGWLLVLPGWVTVLACSLGFFGIAAPDTSPHVRWSFIAYVISFAVAGHPFNVYWGWTVTPIWAYALVTSVGGMSSVAATALAPVRMGSHRRCLDGGYQWSTGGKE